MKITTEQFIQNAISVHGYKYDYSLVEYKNNKTKVDIVCHKHGIFLQKPYHHINRKQNCPKCKGRLGKNYYINDIPLFETYKNQLERCGISCRRNIKDKYTLEVQCMYCNKWHLPLKRQITNKISCMKGIRGGESNLYCSEGCKDSCSTYNQVKYPKDFKPATSREVQPALRKLVLERDNWTCQKCSSTDTLHCHHYEGIEINPIESADVDNCITLCIDCHKEAHQQDGCGMKRKKCKGEI